MDVFDSQGNSIFDIRPKARKKYVLFLFSSHRAETAHLRALEKIIQSVLVDFTVLRFEDPYEGLKAVQMKMIDLIIMDSSFLPDGNTAVDYAVECKAKRKCPIFFLTDNESELIAAYRKKLFFYGEFDDYFPLPLEVSVFSKKMTRVARHGGRRARRFSLRIPLQVFHLNRDAWVNATLDDLSLIGFGLSYSGEWIFVRGEQVRIKLPLREFGIFHPAYGEFLSLSGCTRRISIEGEKLGFSLEFLTPLQTEALMDVLERIMNG